MERRVYINMNLCTSCRSCAAACAVGHNGQGLLKHGHIQEKATEPLHCRHCAEALCLNVCPQKAIKKDENGTVIRMRNLCIACKSCINACPFGVMLPYSQLHSSPKCDLCFDRLAQGQVPRCVATCTSGALVFEELQSIEKKIKRAVEGGRYFARFMLYR